MIFIENKYQKHLFINKTLSAKANKAFTLSSNDLQYKNTMWQNQIELYNVYYQLFI